MKLHSIDTSDVLGSPAITYFFEDEKNDWDLIAINTYIDSQKELEHVYKQLDNALEFVKEIMDKR